MLDPTPSTPRARTNQMDQPESKGLRIISFDGGHKDGVMFQLTILGEIMRLVGWDTNSNHEILPCDYFDMMAGVGTGGIIAILLVVLRLSIEDTREEFLNIWDAVFSDSSLDQVHRSEKLERVMGDLLERHGMPMVRKLAVEESKDRGCKVFVCTVPQTNLGMCEKLRSYFSRETCPSPTVVEAVRATCATPLLFTSVTIGHHLRYISGAYSFNNPTWEAIREACDHFGKTHLVACVISLGSGNDTTNLGAGASTTTRFDLAKAMAFDTKVVARDLDWRIGRSKVYYRFQLDTHCTLSIEEFLAQQCTIEKLDGCVVGAERPGRSTIGDVAGLAEEAPSSANGLPALSAFFVERPALIERMKRCLFRVPLSQRILVLSGLGGIGKTQITISFLRQFPSRFHHILFIDGSTVHTIESGIVAKVKSIGAKYARSTAMEALELLATPDSEITQDWVIVYDNVDGKDVEVARYFPRCRFGTIIITTRNTSLGNLAPTSHIQLDVMSDEEAVKVLLRSAIHLPRLPTENDRRYAQEIARTLGNLPVALNQAGYFIKQHDCMEDYLSRLKQHRVAILRRPAEGQLDDHAHAVYTTFELSWSRLSHRAQLFLNTLGFVNYIGLPLELIYRAAKLHFRFEASALMPRTAQFGQDVQLLRYIFQPDDSISKQDVDDLVAEVEGYSLVTRITTSNLKILCLHPLVHSWIQDRLAQHDQEKHRSAALRLLACATGEDDEDIFDFIYPHVTLFNDRLSSLHMNDRAGIAAIHTHCGDVTVSISIWEGILGELNHHPGYTGYSASEAKLNLAVLYRASLQWPLRPAALSHEKEQAQTQMASALEQEVLEYRACVLGRDHPATIEAVAWKALRRARSRDIVELIGSKKLLDTVLGILETRQCKNWELMCQVKEALAYPRLQEFPPIIDKILERIKSGEELIHLRTKYNGPEHWKTLKAKANLASAYSDMEDETLDKFDKFKAGRGIAVELLESVVAKQKEGRGPEHLSIIPLIELLAESYLKQGAYSHAEEMWKEVIALRRKVDGLYNEHMWDAMVRLSQTYARREKYHEAALVVEEVLALRKEVEGNGNDPMLIS